jgi:hypothetical protein
VIAALAAHDCLFVETSTGLVLEPDEEVLRASLQRAATQQSMTDPDGAIERATGAMAGTHARPRTLQDANSVNPQQRDLEIVQSAKKQSADDETMQVMVCLTAFVVWLPVYLIYVRPEMNGHLAEFGVTGYPAILHLLPVIGVPVFFAYLVGRLAGSGKGRG